MPETVIENLNVAAQEVLITPARLKAALPMSDKAKAVVAEGRETVRNILDGKDHRMFIVVGPCSIHDTELAMDYAQRLKAPSVNLSTLPLCTTVSDSLCSLRAKLSA